jgi:hypothetical protein
MLGNGGVFSNFWRKPPCGAGKGKEKRQIKMHITMKLFSLLALVACLALVGCNPSTTTSTTTNAPASTNK